MYPHHYDRGDADNIWHIHANCELTNKAVSMICEYASKLVDEANIINDKRKLANR